LQGVSAEDSSKAESLGTDALQLGTISAFNWITCIHTEAARLDYYKAFLMSMSQPSMTTTGGGVEVERLRSYLKKPLQVSHQCPLRRHQEFLEEKEA
jgi:hypothetical protein